MIELTAADINRLFPNLIAVGINNKILAYKFTDPIYDGVVFTYTQIKINVIENDTGAIVHMENHADIDPDLYSLQLSFEYHIFENPQNKDITTKHFEEHIAVILQTLIEASLRDY